MKTIRPVLLWLLCGSLAQAQVYPYFPPPGITYSAATGQLGLTGPILLPAIAAPASPSSGNVIAFGAATSVANITSLSVKDNFGGTIALGYEQHMLVANQTGSTLSVGNLVYVNGATGQGVPTVALAKADSLTTLPALGFTQYAIPNGGTGEIHLSGSVGAFTIGFSVGAKLYVSDSVAGAITATAPSTATSYVQQVGVVTTVGGSGSFQLAVQTPVAVIRAVSGGGTGLGTLPVHSVLLGEATSNVGNVAAMAVDTLLQGQGASADPAAVSINNCGGASQALSYSTSTHTFGCQTISTLATPVTVANGGTGLGTLPVHGLLLGEATSNVGNVAAMAADTLLQGQGASADPAAVSINNCGSNTTALSYSTSTHTFGCQTVVGSAGSPGGSTTQVQFNLTGAFAGDAGFTYVGSSTQTTTLGTSSVGPTINATTSSAVGRAFTINGSSGVGTNAGGAINITAGLASGTAGSGGAINITGGTGSSGVNSFGGAASYSAGTATGNTAGPTATFQGGTNNATGAGGVAQLLGGTGGTTSGNGGAVTVQGGTPTTSGNGGNVTVQGGTAGNVAGNSGGTLTIQAGTGTATTTGAVGSAVTINGGTATGSGNNAGGNLTLTAGAAANAASGGVLGLNGGTVGSAAAASYHNIDMRGGSTLTSLNVGSGVSSSLSSIYIQGSNSAANSVNGGDILLAGGAASATSSTGGNIVVRTGGTAATSSNGNIVFQLINESTGAPQTMFTFNGHTTALGLGSSPSYGNNGAMLVSAGSASGPTWSNTVSPIIAGGTKFTTSGCSVSSTTGGGHAGIFTLGANSCTVVVTLNGATGATAPTGWSCQAHDRTAPTVLIGGESSSTTTTASIPIPAGAGATDVISFSCTGY